MVKLHHGILALILNDFLDLRVKAKQFNAMLRAVRVRRSRIQM